MFFEDALKAIQLWREAATGFRALSKLTDCSSWAYQLLSDALALHLAGHTNITLLLSALNMVVTVAGSLSLPGPNCELIYRCAAILLDCGLVANESHFRNHCFARIGELLDISLSSHPVINDGRRLFFISSRESKPSDWRYTVQTLDDNRVLTDIIEFKAPKEKFLSFNCEHTNGKRTKQKRSSSSLSLFWFSFFVNS